MLLFLINASFGENRRKRMSLGYNDWMSSILLIVSLFADRFYDEFVWKKKK